MLSARLGDVLSELYLLSAVLKRWVDEGRQREDLIVVDYAMAAGEARMARAFDGVLRNHPTRWVGWLVRVAAFPFGFDRTGPRDALAKDCAETLLQPSPQRDRLTPDLYAGLPGDALAQLEQAFEAAVAAGPVRRKLRQAKLEDAEAGVAQGVISIAEREELERADGLLEKVVAVDDFAPTEFGALVNARS